MMMVSAPRPTAQDAAHSPSSWLASRFPSRSAAASRPCGTGTGVTGRLPLPRPQVVGARAEAACLHARGGVLGGASVRTQTRKTLGGHAARAWTGKGWPPWRSAACCQGHRQQGDRWILLASLMFLPETGPAALPAFASRAGSGECQANPTPSLSVVCPCSSWKGFEEDDSRTEIQHDVSEVNGSGRNQQCCDLSVLYSKEGIF